MNFTDLILQNNNYDTLSTVLKQHEKQMSEVLDLPEIQKNLFSDFNGVIKSLGAWGGDFVMVLSKENPSLYFREKGYDTIAPLHGNDLIKKPGLNIQTGFLF